MKRSLTEQLERIKFLTYGKQTPIVEVNFTRLSTTNYPNVKYDMDGTQNDSINSDLIFDIQTAANNANLVVTITNVKKGHPTRTKSRNISRHSRGMAVDISRINNTPVLTNKTDTNKFVQELTKLGYLLNKESGNQKAVLSYGFMGHNDHVHVSNTGTSTAPTTNT